MDAGPIEEEQLDKYFEGIKDDFQLESEHFVNRTQDNILDYDATQEVLKASKNQSIMRMRKMRSIVNKLLLERTYGDFFRELGSIMFVFTVVIFSLYQIFDVMAFIAKLLSKLGDKRVDSGARAIIEEKYEYENGIAYEREGDSQGRRVLSRPHVDSALSSFARNRESERKSETESDSDQEYRILQARQLELERRSQRLKQRYSEQRSRLRSIRISASQRFRATGPVQTPELNDQY
jgi:hypothetical protein